MGELVAYRLEGSVATIAMDDGKVNVISRRMLGELDTALDRAAADGAIVILTGRSGVFSAGFDLKELSTGGATTREVLIGGFKLAERLLSFPLPVVIACSGHAMTMGVFLVLSGDHRIAAGGAFKIVANEVAIGLTMPHSAVEICRQRLAPAHFHRAVINAELYTPEQAVPAGFLDEVVPAVDLERVAHDTAARLGKLNLAAHAATKLRARAASLEALRRAIALDDAAFT
jgi:enoyl-CoA hydratase/carnithine racemase